MECALSRPVEIVWDATCWLPRPRRIGYDETPRLSGEPRGSCRSNPRAWTRRLLGGGGRLGRTVHQLDQRRLGAVALAKARLEDARVATRPRRGRRPDLVEQVHQHVA